MGMPSNNKAKASIHTRTTWLSFSATPQNLSWNHLALPQSGQNGARAHPLFLITQWSMNYFTPHLCAETSWPRFMLIYMLLCNVSAALDLYNPQILDNNCFTSYAASISDPRPMGQERYLSATTASKHGKSACHASRYFLWYLSVYDLLIYPSMYLYTADPRIKRWKFRHDNPSPSFEKALVYL